MMISAIATVLGGTGALKTPVKSSAKLVELTRRGLPATILISLADDLAMPRIKVASILGISERTLSRRITSKGRLTQEESDRMVRLARVVALAQQTLGSMSKASRWLQTQNRALEGSAPFDLLDTDAGVQSVETVLGRIAYGVYS